ncbi:MAG: peroxide stress protein YaaA, partial [Rhodothermia bacterium]
RRPSNTFNYFVSLNPERRMVIEAANALDLSPRQFAKTLGVESAQVEKAVACNHEVMTSPLMSALDRYSHGGMYGAMDFENLPTGAQRRLLEHGVIFSSMFGLLRPDDLVPEYYLTHTAKLPGLGSVIDFWQPFVTDAVNKISAGHLVWNLLPTSLLAIWTPIERQSTIVTVEFYRKKRGGLEPVTANLDKLAGGFVNMLVRGSADSIEALEDLRHPKGFEVDFDKSGIDEETGRGNVVLVKR